MSASHIISSRAKRLGACHHVLAGVAGFGDRVALSDDVDSSVGTSGNAGVCKPLYRTQAGSLQCEKSCSRL